MKTKYSAILIIAFTTFVYAQKADYSQYAGYIDFGDLSLVEKGEEVTEVLIEEHLLKMVSKMTKNSEPELSALLEGIKLVKVNAFELSENSFEQLKSRAEKIDKDLMSKNWDRIVKVKSRDEFVNIYIKTEADEKISGLVVTSIEKNQEAAFVNIVGDINLETISKLGDKFDIPSLDKIHKENDKN
ncbi:MAG: DUF4252 domain-containing protein [Melioribacteraceae bacterium]|nr:DUF4252 domain-containing protein [Melioribacteraceae bacterium]